MIQGKTKYKNLQIDERIRKHQQLRNNNRNFRKAMKFYTYAEINNFCNKRI